MHVWRNKRVPTSLKLPCEVKINVNRYIFFSSDSYVTMDKLFEVLNCLLSFMCQVKESTTEMTLHICCPFRYDVCLPSSCAFMQCVMNRAGIKRKSGRKREVFGQ